MTATLNTFNAVGPIIGIAVGGVVGVILCCILMYDVARAA
jgi:tetrahydromethanopterin S-methyltransferase subunit G